MAETTSPWILEATAADFQQQVVERSRQQLVLVDFWAEWCQPCRLLGPILEKLAAEYDGKFTLVKADVEKLPEIAGGFGVQSIPAVYAVRSGEILDFFQGVLPEPQLREWLDRLLPTPADLLIAEADKLVATDPAAAEAKYREAMALAQNDSRAAIALLRLLIANRRDEQAAQLLGELEERGYLEPEAEKLKSQLELRRQGQEVGNVAECRAAVAANPEDGDAKLKLAESLAAAGQFEEALDTALSLIQSDRKRWGEPARKFMVDVFNLLPPDSELLSTYRRRLSTSLY